jgi:hypothetical protein
MTGVCPSWGAGSSGGYAAGPARLTGVFRVADERLIMACFGESLKGSRDDNE